MPSTRSNRVKKILFEALNAAYKARDALIEADAPSKEISEVMARIMALERQLSLVSGAGTGLTFEPAPSQSTGRSRRRRRGGAHRTRRRGKN